MDAVKAYLSPPEVKRVRYQSNFIKTAVCELRFPTLLELEMKAPTVFQAKIRKGYPFYERQVVDEVGGPEVSREVRYIFQSKDRNWTVTLKSFALALETSKYVDFEDFFSRFKQILDSARDIIDSDFFTRVGLRYVNWIPVEDEDLDGWIRGDLISPLTGGVLGAPQRFSGIVQGYMEGGGQYSLRHSLRSEQVNEKTRQTYVLDFDYFSENVEVGNVPALVQGFNKINFALFSWCLGDKAKKRLGEGKPK